MDANLGIPKPQRRVVTLTEAGIDPPNLAGVGI